MVVRSTDPKFMAPRTRWIMRLGKELAPLQVGNGGPILLVQVENEYGSFGNDHAYMEANHQTWSMPASPRRSCIPRTGRAIQTARCRSCPSASTSRHHGEAQKASPR